MEREIERALSAYNKEDRELAKKELLSHVDTRQQTIAQLDAQFDSGKPFSFIRVSDTDALLLCWLLESWKVHRPLLQNLLFWSGVRTISTRDAQAFWEVIVSSTLVGIQEPTHIQGFSFWGPLYAYLKEANRIGARRWNSLHSIYEYVSSGKLGDKLAGKRVVMVGGKVGYFKEFFYKNQHWNDSFPFLRFNDIEIVDWIVTPDLPESSFERREEIERAVQKSYALKPNAFLFSSGLLAKFLSVQVEKECGAIGIDWGNAIESIMNFQCKRPYMEQFSTYEHPTHTFTFLPHLRVLPEPK